MEHYLAYHHISSLESHQNEVSFVRKLSIQRVDHLLTCGNQQIHQSKTHSFHEPITLTNYSLVIIYLSTQSSISIIALETLTVLETLTASLLIMAHH